LDGTTVYLFTDAQCDMHTSLCLLLHNDLAKCNILRFGDPGWGL